MSFVLVFVVFVIICAAIYVTTRDLYNFWVVDRKLKYIPGPPGLPLIRNILDVYSPERNNKFCVFESFILTCRCYSKPFPMEGKIWGANQSEFVLVYQLCCGC